MSTAGIVAVVSVVIAALALTVSNVVLAVKISFFAGQIVQQVRNLEGRVEKLEKQ